LAPLLLPRGPAPVYEPAVLLRMISGSLAVLSLVLLLWQWWVARRFPLHKRLTIQSFAPGLTLLKPLKGCDETTEACLRSWFAQTYAGQVQILFGVAAADDPVCGIVKTLIEQFPEKDARLIICGPLTGTNLKVSKLIQLEQEATQEALIISDADVKVPPDFLSNIVLPLRNPRIGLVNCFYELANPTTLAMRWEAVAINADFWSQVLQSQSLKPLDFALGAVMVVRRGELRAIGGFAALANCLADDYQLGYRIARRGLQIALSPIIVECWSAPMGVAQVWKHQLRWARTIRVCQPVPYFLSILSNATLWPLLWLIACPTSLALGLVLITLLFRIAVAIHLQRLLTEARPRLSDGWVVIAKDLLQALIWLLAFLGNRIEWRGEQFQLRRDGTLVKV
jgi:ceramide glucosyltransferase